MIEDAWRVETETVFSVRLFRWRLYLVRLWWCGVPVIPSRLKWMLVRLKD